MRFLSVAERELRAAARRRFTYLARWMTGLGFFGLLVWLLWVMGGLTNRGAAAEILHVFAVITFLYCLLFGTARTADCISSERRDGTLGLLFLTNLNSAEVVIGKLCSHALASVYALLAIFPIMALPLLMGGITGTEFFHTVLALMNAIFASLVAGLIASVMFTRQFPAVAFAVGLMAIWGLGSLGIAGIIAEHKGNPLLVQGFAVICPLYALLTADGSRIFGANLFWESLAAVATLSVLGCVWATWRLSRTWRDRPAVVRAKGSWKFWQRRKATTAKPTNPRLRQRLLDVNPFYWLAGRKLVSAPIFMILMLLLVLLTVTVTVPFFQSTFRRQSDFAPMIGCLLGWLWTVLAAHVLTLYYAAMISSQRLAEDKQTGALEMILCTPTTERAISRGLWQAFFRRMTFPAGAVVLLHGAFLWLIMVMCTFEPPTNQRSVQGNGTPGEYFWAILWNEPVRGIALDWEFIMLMRVVIFLLPSAFLIWITLGWVGRWLGLKMKHPGFAPLLALALTFIPPIIGFSILCYIADKLGFFRGSNRQTAPIVILSAFAWGSGYCLLLCLWAADRLRNEFRHIVTSRFQPMARRRWWVPNWRLMLRFALWLMAIGGGMVVLVVGYYAVQNWNLQRNWKKFQAEVQQRGDRPDFPLVQPTRVPEAENLAMHPVFQQSLREVQSFGGQTLGSLVFRLSNLQDPYQRWPTDATAPWPTRKFFPLDEHARWIESSRKFGVSTNRAEMATAMLADLAKYREALSEFAEAAKLPYYQTRTNCDVETVIRSDQPESVLLERVHFIFALRASAALATGDHDAAAVDVLTGLRLARLARQTLDARAALRQQILLVRTLQPLWEGMCEQRWTATELTQFESELRRFTLLTDYTNDVRRVVQAHLQLWSRFPDLPSHLRQIPSSNGNSYSTRSHWQHEPGNWWYERCRLLHAAGERAIAKLDIENGWASLDRGTDYLHDLPLNDDVFTLLQPYPWNNPRPTTLAFAQAALNQALIACALERYRLARGSYPEKLSQLVSEYLPEIPPDPVARRPMSYERNPAGRYTLRSFGVDREDDRVRKVNDDWLWTYPTNQPSVGPGK